MKKMDVVCLLTMIVGVVLVSMGFFIQNENSNSLKPKKDEKIFNLSNMAASTNMIFKRSEDKEEVETPNLLLTEVEMEVSPASIIIPPRIEVYEGMTLEELGAKLNRHLGTDVVAGKGEFIAAECINRGVDPYIVVAIILQETGCGSYCSPLARYCNNFGGQKGSPGCNGGAFRQFDTIDEGLVGLISNLQRNYYAMGLNTVETIAPKYCEGNEWAGHINWFVNKIRNN